MTRTSILLALLCIFLWGLTFPLIKFLMMAGTPALTLVAVRFFVGFIVCIPFVAPPRGEWLKVFLLSLTLFALPLALTNYAIKDMDSALVALVSQLEVPFAWILSVLFLKERITIRQIAGLVVSFLGIYFLSNTPEVAGVEHFFSVCLVLLVAFFYGLASIQLKYLRANAGTITVWSFFFSFILTGLAAVICEAGENVGVVFTPVNFGVTILVAALSMMAFYLWTYLLSYNAVNAVVPFVMLVPISTLVFAYFLLGETTEVSALLGGLVTLVGVGLQIYAPES